MSEVDLSSPPPEEFLAGIEQFNQGEYYACHDTLEAIWMTAPVFEKPFYQGILQSAVALYHLGNHNWRGAAILLGESLQRLQQYEPEYQGVDVTELVDSGFAWLEALQTLGPEQVRVMANAVTPGLTPIKIREFDLTLPPLHISLTDHSSTDSSGS
ncbi:DUF309 domain-containing protein [Pseudanabaena sp. FACHB-2040]|uniref:DUF309 domain-containing protein n=1 Tax=Pseudanabaena sp. FACHB-2040 TaxID=2692859 RepID=UPI0018EF8B9C|nr:DUF309 domain-containing protein [Pseudanabaena sp. FACHB-2040]